MRREIIHELSALCPCVRHLTSVCSRESVLVSIAIYARCPLCARQADQPYRLDMIGGRIRFSWVSSPCHAHGGTLHKLAIRCILLNVTMCIQEKVKFYNLSNEHDVCALQVCRVERPGWLAEREPIQRQRHHQGHIGSWVSTCSQQPVHSSLRCIR